MNNFENSHKNLNSRVTTLTSNVDELVYCVEDISTQLASGKLNYLTEAPTADNTDGLIIVVLEEEPEVRYNGYLYFILG